MTWETYLNFGLVIVITIASLYYALKGRRVDRKLMLYNFGAGMLVIIGYSLFIVDAYFYDFATMKEVSAWLIKPIYTITIFALLWNIFRIGHRDDNEH